MADDEWLLLAASLEDNASPDIEKAMQRFFAQDNSVLNRAQVTIPELGP